MLASMPALGRYESEPGELYGTPKELYALRYKARGKTPLARAKAFLSDRSELLGLDPKLRDLDKVVVRQGLQTFHVIFRQLVHGLRVRRGYVSVHLDRGGHIYLVKNRAVPLGHLPQAFVFRNARDAEVVARATLKSAARKLVEPPERMWFPIGARLEPAFRVRLRRRRPRELVNVFVHAVTGDVLHVHDNVAHIRVRSPRWATTPPCSARTTSRASRPTKPTRASSCATSSPTVASTASVSPRTARSLPSACATGIATSASSTPGTRGSTR
jgi:hypothetical protein